MCRKIHLLHLIYTHLQQLSIATHFKDIIRLRNTKRNSTQRNVKLCMCSRKGTLPPCRPSPLTRNLLKFCDTVKFWGSPSRVTGKFLLCVAWRNLASKTHNMFPSAQAVCAQCWSMQSLSQLVSLHLRDALGCVSDLPENCWNPAIETGCRLPGGSYRSSSKELKYLERYRRSLISYEQSPNRQ